MASFFNISSRFGRGANKQPNTAQSPSPTDQRSPDSLQSPVASISSGRVVSPSLPDLAASDSGAAKMAEGAGKRVPYFFREENAGLIVKGNFMTLAAKPEIVEKGEWLAHQGKKCLSYRYYAHVLIRLQVVEQYRLMEGMLKIIQETDSKTRLPICNQQSCPHMTAVEYDFEIYVR